MNEKERAAMQQALEVLEACVEKFYAMKSTGVIGAVPMQAVKAAQVTTSLREALAEPQIMTPDVCGEVCERAKLCYGCNKDLEEANAKYVEQAEQEPVAKRFEKMHANGDVWITTIAAAAIARNAAPVRTKDLTDDEIARWFGAATEGSLIEFARAVIAADREKNK